MPQTPSFTLTIRAEIASKIGNFGRIMATIGDAGAEVGGADIVRSTKASVTRDITVAARDRAHADQIVAALDALDGVAVLSANDRVTLAHMGGKIGMQNRAQLTSRDDLSMAYTPGVARVCMAIHDDPERTWDLTIRGNSVAVITDGSSVVGQGNLGPVAALPSAEAKCMFLRELAGIDGFPLPLDVSGPQQITDVVTKITSVFAGVLITDMAAPTCFQVQASLSDALDIPVMHDRQQGTAASLLAGLINSLGLVGKDLAGATVVVAGLGASGVAAARLFVAAGVGNVITCNRAGAVHAGSTVDSPELEWIAKHTNPTGVTGELREIVRGADALIGVAEPNVLGADAIRDMAKDPIVFALSTPDPDVSPDAAATGGAAVYATGRPDLPNQINSSLAFPGIWRGALDCRATRIDDTMLLAAAKAIAETSAGAVAADHVVPSVFNPELVPNVARAVREAAEAAGFARISGSAA